MAEVESRLGLNRQNLAGLALLLGCDYLPGGVPGCGKRMVRTFLTSLKGESVLDR